MQKAPRILAQFIIIILKTLCTSPSGPSMVQKNQAKEKFAVFEQLK